MRSHRDLLGLASTAYLRENGYEVTEDVTRMLINEAETAILRFLTVNPELLIKEEK